MIDAFLWLVDTLLIIVSLIGLAGGLAVTVYLLLALLAPEPKVKPKR